MVFLILLGGLAALNLATPPRAVSENENRQLQQMPEFSGDALVSGRFTSGFDQFVIDQFVFRDRWVGVKTMTELALGRKSSGGVYFADDGYLIEMFDTVDLGRYEKNLDIIGDFSRRAESGLGVTVRTILAPTASMVLADKLPRYAPEIDQRALFMLAEKRVPGLVDVSVELGRHSGEYIYYRTDHHWTSLGAYYAYAQWRGQSGRVFTALGDFGRETLSDRFFGTTYSKANLYNVSADTITAFRPKGIGPLTVDYNNGEKVTDTIYERSFLGVKDQYSVFLNANQPVARIATGNPNGEKLLVIKDSYANTFIQMLLADYTEVYVIDPRYFKLPVYDYIRENGITEVLILYSVKNFAGDTNLYYLTA